jgi:hypothetical protein
VVWRREPIAPPTTRPPTSGAGATANCFAGACRFRVSPLSGRVTVHLIAADFPIGHRLSVARKKERSLCSTDSSNNPPRAATVVARLSVELAGSMASRADIVGGPRCAWGSLVTGVQLRLIYLRGIGIWHRHVLR